MKKIDLHLHTTASDGSFTPRQLVEEAKDKGLKAIAVTDHDTVAGIKEAQKRGKELGIEVIAGIELTTYYQDKRIDILGYRIDVENQELLDIIDKLQNTREVRAKEILLRLRDLEIELDFNALKKISGDKGVGRPHVAKLLLQEGYVDNLQEAFDKYLEDGGPAYVPKYRLEPSDATSLIDQAGGISILAHPGEIVDDQLVKELIKLDGLAGIEAYYPKHSKKQTENYLNLAQKNNLIITGGSDCHGPANQEKYLIASLDVSYNLLNKLR